MLGKIIKGIPLSTVVSLALIFGSAFVAGCSNQIAKNRAEYFSWAIHQHREFEQEKTRSLPTKQYFSCGDQHHPCKPITKISNRTRSHKEESNS